MNAMNSWIPAIAFICVMLIMILIVILALVMVGFAIALFVLSILKLAGVILGVGLL